MWTMERCRPLVTLVSDSCGELFSIAVCFCCCFSLLVEDVYLKNS